MQNSTNQKPIVRKYWKGDWLAQYTSKVFLDGAESRYFDVSRAHGERAIEILRGFLVAYDLAIDPNRPSAALKTLQAGIGAILSPEFFESTQRNRHSVGSEVLSAIKRVMDENDFHPYDLIHEVRLHINEESPFSKHCVELYRELTPNVRAQELVRGWRIENLAGRVTWLPLHCVLLQHGPELTRRLHLAAETFFGARRSVTIFGFPQFCEYLAKQTNEFVEEARQDPEASRRLFRGFTLYFVQQRSTNSSIATIVGDWQNGFRGFAKNHLIHPTLFASPAGGLPELPQQANSSPTNTRMRDGVEVSRKLTYEVPLSVTDDEAIEIIFTQLVRDEKIVRAWACERIAKLSQRISNRVAQGRRARNAVLDQADAATDCNAERLNAQKLAHASYTFERHGYQTQEDTYLQRIYRGVSLPLVAEHLGLPVTGALFPHCALLVLEHPELTAAFLDNVMVYDDLGNRTGYIEADSGNVLVGYKMRRGEVLAQQNVSLSAQGKWAVDEILNATRPVREYLRSRNAPEWRYLLLSTGLAFGKPICFKYSQKAYQQPSHRNRIAQELHSATGEPIEYCQRLSNALTLTSLRATCGVIEFIRTRSPQRMAEKLGHKEYSPSLLGRYLPAPLARFFSSRWIRVFQEGLILQIMDGSPHQLRASSFDSMDALHDFLRNHALDLPNSLASRESTRATTEIVVGVNLEILTALISLRAAVHDSLKTASSKATYWASMADCIEAEIGGSKRPDLVVLLSEAQSLADSTRFKDVIHAR